jgi:hypothetical protein
MTLMCVGGCHRVWDGGLKILAEHLFEAVDDPTLIAHWPSHPF